MSGAGGFGDISPLSRGDIEAYKAEYEHGLDLFGRALEQCTKSGNIHQQEAFKHVMDRALQVLNETARGLKRTDLLQQNDKIAQDFQAYGAHKDALGERVLKEDLDLARKKL